MSYSVDTNILLYASDESSPQHAIARRFLEAREEDPDLFCLAWVTLLGYQRIATHPGIFSKPLSPQVAWQNVKNLLALPRVRIVGEGETFLEDYEALEKDLVIRGNLVPDAHLATILREHGVGLIYTNDSDFRKFPFLKVKNPLGQMPGR